MPINLASKTILAVEITISYSLWQFLLIKNAFHRQALCNVQFFCVCVLLYRIVASLQLLCSLFRTLLYRDTVATNRLALAKDSSSSSSSFEGYPLQVRHKQDWGRGFILLLPQTAELPASDAGSNVIKPASCFVIQNRQTSCSIWCPMYRALC